MFSEPSVEIDTTSVNVSAGFPVAVDVIHFEHGRVGDPTHGAGAPVGAQDFATKLYGVIMEALSPLFSMGFGVVLLVVQVVLTRFATFYDRSRTSFTGASHLVTSSRNKPNNGAL